MRTSWEELSPRVVATLALGLLTFDVIVGMMIGTTFGG